MEMEPERPRENPGDGKKWGHEKLGETERRGGGGRREAENERDRGQELRGPAEGLTEARREMASHREPGGGGKG